MKCTNCQKEITLDNIVMAPIVIPNSKVIDNITIYSKDCAESGCFHHIHIVDDDEWNTMPTEGMTLKKLIIREHLAHE